ncbi:CinA family protein [Caballeronia sp. EK]|jgi:PncC family amidohydrolase|uniref:CinA family protein n=1 Tax=Caballeronia sp. EK TaxID=2767469 RepID=UPI001654CF4A|nr:CinA family protein [Caballeronia sp. EK]MBC8642588.1 CinA family protein [Caballeronia sp. EK]
MDIPRQVVSFLSSRGLKLATAESCTAGFIASLISSVPGSGACLDVGFITYSPSGKAGFLDVQEETMNRFGLTSEEVAREMSEGALRLEACCADVSVSNTGVADGHAGSGPAPGTQCFGWSFKLQGGRILSVTETQVFEGDRNEVRHAAALYALSRIEHHFNHLPSVSGQYGDANEHGNEHD